MACFVTSVVDSKSAKCRNCGKKLKIGKTALRAGSSGRRNFRFARKREYPLAPCRPRGSWWWVCSDCAENAYNELGRLLAKLEQ